MKNECAIVRDLIPLYVEEMTSQPSAEFVRKHIAECAECKAVLEETRSSEVKVNHPDRINTLRSLYLGIFLKTLLLAAAVFVFILGIFLPDDLYIAKAACGAAASALAVVFYHELGGKSIFSGVVLSILVNIALAAQQINVLYSKPMPEELTIEQTETLLLSECRKLAVVSLVAIVVSVVIVLLLSFIREKTAGKISAVMAGKNRRVYSLIYLAAATLAFVGEALILLFTPEEYAMLFQWALCLAVGVFVGLYRAENGAKSPLISAIFSFITSILPTAIVLALEAVIFNGIAEFSVFVVIDISVLAVCALVSAIISASITRKTALAESREKP